MKAKPDSVLQWVRQICLSLPDAVETETWGKPHFRVTDKIFAGYGEEHGKRVVGFKLEMDHARFLVEKDPRFSRAPYVGHKGWVSMDAAEIRDSDELRELLIESYRLIAPRRSLAKLAQPEGDERKVTKKTKRKSGQRKAAAKSKARTKPPSKPAIKKTTAKKRAAAKKTVNKKATAKKPRQTPKQRR